MTDPVTIREATAADVPAIAALLADDGLGRGREAPGDDPVYATAFAAMTAPPAMSTSSPRSTAASSPACSSP